MNIPRQIKNASVSLTLRYHLSMFSIPLHIACLTSENFSFSAMFSHDCKRNSRTGIVRHTVGSIELENVCFAVAGSYNYSAEIITSQRNLDNYLKNFMH